mmetsp:Transcript_50741/g.135298  ORF Transcript_50741/g.135298 Transcript_50741/m.135298 type:complete len:235 (+) Transcript_50741:2264-2968(+)
MRSPSLKMLIVFALGLEASKLSTTPMAWFTENRCETFVFLRSAVKNPSESKQTLSFVSPRKRDESWVEKPTRTCCRGRGTRVFLPIGSCGFRASMIFTSYMYLPCFTPVLARDPATRYCRPPSVSGITILPPKEIMTLSVVSRCWKLTSSASLSRSSDSASTSRSTGTSGSRFTSCHSSSLHSSFMASSFISSFVSCVSPASSVLRFFASCSAGSSTLGGTATDSLLKATPSAT